MNVEYIDSHRQISSDAVRSGVLARLSTIGGKCRCAVIPFVRNKTNRKKKRSLKGTGGKNLCKKCKIDLTICNVCFTL